MGLKLTAPVFFVGRNGSIQLPGLTGTARDKAIDLVCLSAHRKEDQPTNAWGLYSLVNECNRRSSRSPFAVANRDMSLLEEIQVLAADQVALAEAA